MNQLGCQIVTGARLHLGLIDTITPFGGIGFMVDKPHTIVSIKATPGLAFSADGPGRERAVKVAQRFTDFVDRTELPQAEIKILERPHSHTGLGTGTQLDIAVAEGLAYVTQAHLEPLTLAANIAGRGRRSAVGVHGYWRGGFIFDCMPQAAPEIKRQSGINPIDTRLELPAEWRVALLRPTEIPQDKIAGEVEQQHFDALPRPSAKQRQDLLVIIQNTLLPAAREGDFDRFSAGVRRYNYQAGMFFAPIQGDAYNGAAIRRCVDHLVASGFEGVGQSSWGPTVFVLCEGVADTERLPSQVPDGWLIDEIASPLNHGREHKATS